MSFDLAPGSFPISSSIAKAATGIRGLDEITGGGFPRGRSTLVVGPAGSGKTLLGIEFLVRGALEFAEAGVLLSFEEAAGDLAANVMSMGYDLAQMERDRQLVVDAIRLDPAEIIASGQFDLDGLFIRLGAAVDSIGAKRVLLDTVEVLFSALGNDAIVRAELGRLFRWLKERGLTAVVTAEPGAGTLTRHGVEEYVSDCVVVLDHRTHEQVSTRRLRVAKYRGSLHGTNEYPFLISDRGFLVLPVTSLTLSHLASRERISTGVERLDVMLGGGIFRGSSCLITGEAGTGKTTLCAQAVVAACGRGERALLVSFEESPAQLVRNMTSVGIDLQPWIDGGLLQICAVRPLAFGLEAHLANLVHLVEGFGPSVVALDAITGLGASGDAEALTETIVREVDYLKSVGITAFMASLTHGGEESSSAGVSSLMDTWLLLRNVESNGERNRLLFIRKSRGSGHSNQVREFVMSSDGIELVDVPVGPGGVLVGSARLARESEMRAALRARDRDLQRHRRELARRRTEVEAQIAALQLALEEDESELDILAGELAASDASSALDKAAVARLRWAGGERTAEPGGAHDGDAG